MNGPPFNFFKEINNENHYHLLFPKREVGLAIAWLYQQILDGFFPDSTFKETDIHDALDKMHPAAKKPDHRKQTDRFNIIVSDLQHYFIRYDEDKQAYFFKEYGIEFCKQAFDTLYGDFEPTRIEKICTDLKNALEACLTESDLKDWLDIKFSTFKPQLRHQIDYLERQIDKSVNEIRQSRIKKDDASILETLRGISERFDLIRKQNKELSAAFRELDYIKQVLEQKSLSIEGKDLGDKVFAVQQFVQEMKKLLGMVDQRLDRIQPKVKQLFANLNKPLFNARIEKFLTYLLDHSPIVTVKSRKLLRLPDHIPEWCMYKQKLRFTVVERKKDLFPSTAKRKRTYRENKDRKKKAYTKSKKRFQEQNKVDLWFNQIQHDLEQKQEISFTSYFFRAFHENDQNLELAINLAYRVVQEHNQYGWQLHFGTEMGKDQENKHLQIRKMLIQKKQHEAV